MSKLQVGKQINKRTTLVVGILPKGNATRTTPLTQLVNEGFGH
jgi:hypothetical protein